MTLIEFFAWFTVVGLPLLVIAGVIWLLVRWLRKTKPISQPYAHTPSKPAWAETKTTITTTNETEKEEPEFPKNLHIDPSEWDDSADVDCRKIVEAGIRVWRVYRSVDQQNWAECDPALTERAACNYATYIKRNNPDEYVRVNDPEGLIVSYE